LAYAWRYSQSFSYLYRRMHKTETIIQPPSKISLGIKELLQYRELFYFFTWRDIKVKYKQTFLGILWAVLQPLGMMLLFTFIFSKTLKMNSGTVAYPVFVLSGLILWNLFNTSVSHAAESIIVNAGIIKKIYFPRLIIPCSAVLTALFDFIMAFIIFIGISIYHKQPLHWSAIYYFPAGIILVLTAAFGLGTFLSALNIKYRDFRYLIPFLMQVLFFASQVIYPLQVIKSPLLKYVLSVNPVNGAIELFRAALTETAPDITVIAVSTAAAIIFCIAGIYYFRKTESHFADIA
jgi:lipopolysaccharide transport system permease protein